MKPFKHHSAHTIKEAVRLLSAYEGKARVNAGGSDLLGAMKDKILPQYPEAVIDIKTIEGLDYIKEEKRGVRIGALTKLADLAGSAVLKEHYGLLTEAVRSVASPHIRNVATIGGNLAQDVRCWYYRYPRQIGGPIVCLRKGGKNCNALGGDNRYHSIFGAAPMAQYPCSGHCPVETPIRSYLEHVKAGDFERAAEMIMEHNPIPAITGRVCPANCEANCNRGEFDEPVAIRSIERLVGDYILQNADRFYRKPARETGKSAAVVGSGPAGLTAAFYLRRAGYRVVIFERLEKAGGMLSHSIPAYRLPRPVVDNQIKALTGMGIEVRTGVDVGADIVVSSLISEYDTVFIACGAWKEQALGIEGEEMALSGLSFLNGVAGGKRDLPGRKVAVIGGGNVALDVARTLRRLGADASILYRRTESEMPAFRDEIEKAYEEGVEFSFLTLPTRLTRTDGTISVESVRMRLGDADASGRPRPEPIPGSGYVETFDAVIHAIGEKPDSRILPDDLRKQGEGLSALSCGDGRIFTGGDFVTGPSTVAAAIASGREAAREMISSLTDHIPPRAVEESTSNFVRSSFSEIPRIVLREAPVAQRLVSIDGEDLSLPGEAAIMEEAHRCFNCGCLAVNPSDIAVALVALGGEIVTTGRIVKAEDFFRSTASSSTILDAHELIREIRIPKPPAGSVQKYVKFTLRKPIDFAIVSVASLVSKKNGSCKDARIVLGAVAPEPLRVRAAEAALKGRPVDETSASEAALMAARGVSFLSKNGYKADILKTMVKRSLLGQNG